MATMDLDALETLEIQAWRTEDADGDVTLIIKTDEGTVRIRCGRTADDADRLADALGTGQIQAAKVAEDWDDRPSEDDGYIGLDRRGWYVQLGGQPPADMTRDGYPTEEIATYELARMLAAAGEFPPCWAEGEHGPSTRPISEQVYAHLDDGDQLKPLPGVKYADRACVLAPAEDWTSWVVVRDYGDLGVMVHTLGDDTVTMLAKHDQLTPDPDDDPA